MYNSACSINQGVYCIAKVDLQNLTQVPIHNVPNGFGVPDITMDKAGNFYVTDWKHLLKVVPKTILDPPPSWNYVSYDTLATIPSSTSLGGIVSLAIDCNEKIFLGDIDNQKIWTYDLHSGQLEYVGIYDAYYFDFEFFEGDLYAHCYEFKSGLGHTYLMRIHLDDLNVKDTVMEIQSNPATDVVFGLANINVSCDTNLLISPGWHKYFKYNVEQGSISEFPFPLLCAGGSTSPTSWMGSYTPLKIESIGVSLSDTCSSTYDIHTYIRRGRYMRPDIQYSLDGVFFSTDSIFRDVPPGKYVVSVRDSFGCIRHSDTLHLKPRDSLTFQSFNTSCGLNNGRLIGYLPDSTLSWSWSIDGSLPTTQDTLSGLSTGTHFIKSMYSNGCTDTSTIFIKADPIPDMSVKSVIIDDKCSLHSGVIDLVSSDLTQKIKYSSDGVTFYFDSIFLSNLAQGTYMIFLEHEKGCKDTLSYFINAFSPPIITHIDLSPPSCGKSDGSMAIFTTNSNDTIYLNGLIQPANTVSNLSQGTYHISVKNTRGCQKDTVINIEGKNLPALPELITFDAHCNMDNGRIVITDSQPSVTYSIDGLHFFNNASFDSLSAGTYKFFVRNMEGCMITKDLIIGQTGSPTIDSVVVLDATCGLNNGSARVFAISYHGLDYRLMQDSIQPSPIFQHLSPGSYTLTVIDSFFCSSTQSFIIQDLYSINSIGKVSIKKGDCTQSLTHISFPEDSVISYTIINQNPSSDGTYYLLPGSYTIRVENENCYIDSTIQVSAISCTPFVPNIFSPNGDGINDLFKVEGSGFDVVSFHVFNRWGAEVFLASDNRGWDGVFRQSEAPQGVYVYFIQIKNDNHLYLLKGNVTLLR